MTSWIDYGTSIKWIVIVSGIPIVSPKKVLKKSHNSRSIAPKFVKMAPIDSWGKIGWIWYLSLAREDHRMPAWSRTFSVFVKFVIFSIQHFFAPNWSGGQNLYTLVLQWVFYSVTYACLSPKQHENVMVKKVLKNNYVNNST